MSIIENWIRDSKEIKKDLIPVTVRLTKEMNSFIEGLADHFEKSKQEIMFALLKDGMDIAINVLKLNEDFDSSSHDNFHILNTNKRNDEDDQVMMMERKIAAAFYDPWKKNIDRIKKNDIVFLYENGVGIIAYGKGSGKRMSEAKYGDKDECYYQELNDFKVLETPISAREVKKILGRNVVFLRTMSSMPDGQKIIESIK